MQADNTQPQTPMLSAPKSSVMDGAFQKIVRNEELKNRSREVNNPIQRLSLEVEQINNSMKVMQDELRRDMRARRKYFLEETKLRREETKDLRRIRTAALFDIRAAIAAGSGLLALKEFSEGDIGGGLQATGVGIAALAPEITDLVVSILAAKGLMGAGRGLMGQGARGVGTAGFLKNIGGKKGLFLISALAASILGSQLLGGGGNDADVRRLRETRKQVRGANLINEGDVDRFRGQLNRFESILDNIGSVPSKERKQKTSAREIDDIGGDTDPNEVDITKAASRFSAEINDGVINKNQQDGGKEVSVNQDTSEIQPAVAQLDLSDDDAKTQIEAENKLIGDIIPTGEKEEESTSPLTALLSSMVPIEGVTDNKVIGSSGMVEGDIKDASTFTELSDILANKDLGSKEFMADEDFIGPKWLGIKNPFKGDKNKENKGTPTPDTKSTVESFDLSSDNASGNFKTKSPSTVVNADVSVDSNFQSDTGSAFDKLDSKGSYRTSSVY